MVNPKIAVYVTCRALGLFRVARWLTRRNLKILCYHGFELADEASFRPKLFIDGTIFAQRLGWIKRQGFHVLPLDEAVQRLYSGTLPDDALVITIDDGFHSVNRVAAPLLKRYAFPGAVYLTTYYVEHAQPIFRLVVQYMFWKTRQTDFVAPVPVDASRTRFDLADPTQRERATWTVIKHGEKRCSELERNTLCAEVGQLLDVPYGPIVASRALHLMTPDELATLADAGLSVELHTHRHMFPDDDRAAAEREIRDNRAALQRLVHRAPEHFCYPSGLWTEPQWDWLDAMGVRSSTTCLPGLNSAATPRHALRRFLDSANIHPVEFEAALCGFSDLLRALRDALQGGARRQAKRATPPPRNEAMADAAWERRL